jgi:DNA polymerase III alpha subunit
MQLQGFPDAGIDAILDERERRGPFASFEDFLERCGDELGPAAIRVLIRSGAFDSLLGSKGNARAADEKQDDDGEKSADARRHHEDEKQGGSRPRVATPAVAASPALPQYRGDLFWRLAAGERSREKKGRGAMRSLLPPLEAGSLPRSQAYEERTALEQEIEALGFLISRHPLNLFRRHLERVRPVRACDLGNHVGLVVRVVGWYVTAKTVMTRHGEPMEFLSFEDTTALYETTFFPRTYARFCHMMTKVRPYLLTGRVEEDSGAISLNVSDLRFLDAMAADREVVDASSPLVRGGSMSRIPIERTSGGAIDAGCSPDPVAPASDGPPDASPGVLAGMSSHASPERPAHVGGTSPRSEAWRRTRV